MKRNGTERNKQDSVTGSIHTGYIHYMLVLSKAIRRHSPIIRLSPIESLAEYVWFAFSAKYKCEMESMCVCLQCHYLRARGAKKSVACV
jgi:hypothetical protein